MKHQVIFIFLLIATQVLTLGCAETPVSLTETTPVVVSSELGYLMASVVGTDFNSPMASETDIIDGYYNSNVMTTNLTIGDSRFITIDLFYAQNIKHIELIDNISKSWAMGDMEIYTSDDNSSYTLYDSIHAINMTDAKGYVALDVDASARYIKLVMTYNGSGTYGFSPQFTISEITVIGEI